MGIAAKLSNNSICKWLFFGLLAISGSAISPEFYDSDQLYSDLRQPNIFGQSWPAFNIVTNLIVILGPLAVFLVGVYLCCEALFAFIVKLGS